MANWIKCQRPRTGYLALLLFYYSMLSTIATEACVICIPYPQTTLADRLIGSDAVVMAREIADTLDLLFTGTLGLLLDAKKMGGPPLKCC